MANWTTYQDVLDTWVGDNKPEDTDLITALIEKAETIILASFPKIQDRITAETMSIKVVRLVVVNMVERVLRNPEGKSSYSYTTGPFAESANYSGSKTGIWLTDEEESLLAPNTKGKAFSVDLKAGSNKVYNAEGVYYKDYFATDTGWTDITRESDQIFDKPHNQFEDEEDDD
jgi:hypothetical protein